VAGVLAGDWSGPGSGLVGSGRPDGRAGTADRRDRVDGWWSGVARAQGTSCGLFAHTPGKTTGNQDPPPRNPGGDRPTTRGDRVSGHGGVAVHLAPWTSSEKERRAGCRRPLR